jgi:uncharacterized membrane protein YphA (DoxX/SURF4 family)
MTDAVTDAMTGRGTTVAAWALRIGLGGLFVGTGALKLADPSAFALEIHNYQLLPALAPVLAAALPAVEIVVGLAMLAGTRPWARAGAVACAALMVVFTVAVGSAVARGVNISCGCFGAGSGPVTGMTVARDVALLAAAAALLRLLAPPSSSPSSSDGSSPAIPA